MIPRPVCPPRAIRMALGAVLVLGAAGAQAMSVSYQCIGYRPLTAELTPRQGQVHFEGHDWTVVRVRGAREARYVSAKDNVTVVTKERTLTLTYGTETLACYLKTDALPDKPAVKGQ
jgi:hypothetical protein